MGVGDGGGAYEGIGEGLIKVKSICKSYLETNNFATCAKNVTR